MLSHYEQYGSIIDSQAGSVLSQCSAKSEVPKQCRVCLDEASSKINPLLSVCSCAGSAKFIHFECLKTWLEGKLNLRVNSPHSIE
jgi:E3 ubiquitin-protein ligase DOA10